MKKRIIAIILVAALIVGIIPSFNVRAEVPDWFTVSAIQAAGITDEKFAAGVYEAVSANADFDLSNYDNVKDALRAYTSDSGLQLVNKGITAINGINLLPNVMVNLDYNDIEDATPLYETGVTRSLPISLRGNPIHIWPKDFPNVNADTYSIVNPLKASAEAVYIRGDGEEAKVQNVVYDVYVGNATATWIVGSNTYYLYDAASKVVPSKAAPEATDTKSVYNVTGDGSVLTRVQLSPVTYTSDGDTQTLRPSYYFTLTSTYYSTLKAEVTSKTTGGFYLAKFNENDTECTTPIGGAVYEVRDAEGTLVGEYTTLDGDYVKVSGLEAGTYYIKEVTPPQGYSISEEVTSITIEAVTAEKSVTGGYTSLDNITKQTSTWTTDWATGYNNKTEKMVLTSEDATTKTASDYNVDTFIKNGGKTVTISFNDNNTDNKYSKSGTYTVTKGSTVNTTPTTEDELNALVNGYITDKQLNSWDDNITVSYAAEYTLNEESYLRVNVVDKEVTIWIENTTGDEENSPYDKNDGGKVSVVGFDDTESKISSDGNDNNNNNRKATNVVKGVADTANGWRVALDRVAVGPRGENGSGATTYITSLDTYNEETGEFSFVDANGKTIKGTLKYDKRTETVTVTINNMDQDIDVAVPFVRSKLMIDNVTPDYDENGLTDEGGTVLTSDGTGTTPDKDVDPYEWGTTKVEWVPKDEFWRHGDKLVIKVFENDNKIEKDQPVQTSTFDLYDKDGNLKSAETLQAEIRKVWPNATVEYVDNANPDAQPKIVLTLDAKENMPYATEVDVTFIPSIWVENTTGEWDDEDNKDLGGTVKISTGHNPADPVDSGDHLEGRDPGLVKAVGTADENWEVNPEHITIADPHDPDTKYIIKELETYDPETGNFSIVIDGVTVYGNLTYTSKTATVTITNANGLPTSVDIGIPFVQIISPYTGESGMTGIYLVVTVYAFLGFLFIETQDRKKNFLTR